MWVLWVIVALCALFLWLIAPRCVQKAKAAPLLRLPFAHRGLHDATLPENSLPAFAQAVAQGYAIELDVHLSCDGVLMVHHDDTLQRMCKQPLQVENCTQAQLQQYPLGQSDARIPTLAEVLACVQGQVPLLIELKTPHYLHYAALCQVLWVQMQHYDGPWCVEAFNPLALLWFRCHHKQVLRGQLATVYPAPFPQKLLYGACANLLLNFLSRPHFIAYNCDYANRWSLRLCRTLFAAPTLAWTVRTPQQAQAAKSFTQVIFEHYLP